MKPSTEIKHELQREEDRLLSSQRVTATHYLHGWWFMLYLTLAVWAPAAVAQIRPSATGDNNNNLIPFCSNCQLHLANAWDTDPKTYATLELNSSLSGSAYVVYEFTNAVAQHDNLILSLGFGGSSGFLSGLIAATIADHVSIQLQDNTGTPLATYGAGNVASVRLVSTGSNRFEIRIINPSADTKRIRIEAGFLASFLGRDLHIYDIQQEEVSYNFATTFVAGGYSEGGSIVAISLCGGCNISNGDHATVNYDPNSDYTSMVADINISTDRNFLFAQYDWNGTYFSGLDYDIYLVLSQPSFATLTTDLFDRDQLVVVINYSDGSHDTFSASENASFVEARVLYTGSEKF